MLFLADVSWIYTLLAELKMFADAKKLPTLAAHLADASQIAEIEWCTNGPNDASILDFEWQLIARQQLEQQQHEQYLIKRKFSDRQTIDRLMDQLQQIDRKFNERDLTKERNTQEIVQKDNIVFFPRLNKIGWVPK